MLTLADFEHKRQRRTRPLDLDRPIPVVVAGRADERSTIRCVGVCVGVFAWVSLLCVAVILICGMLDTRPPTSIHPPRPPF